MVRMRSPVRIWLSAPGMCLILMESGIFHNILSRLILADLFFQQISNTIFFKKSDCLGGCEFTCEGKKQISKLRRLGEQVKHLLAFFIPLRLRFFLRTEK